MSPESRRPRWLSFTSSTVVATLGLTVAALLPATPAEASAPLRDHAAARGKFIGAALATGPLSSDSTYRNIAATEFNQITAENVMKWDTLQPSEGNFNFSGADQIMQFAQQNGQQVHGHVLVWHNQTPGWVQGLPASRMRAVMLEHIARVVGRYANNPALKSWDVVNEIFNEDGTWRRSFWYNTLGESFVADAFRAARQADPDAKLCINDYNVEGINAKSTAMYNLVRSLLQQGVPIDCVGLQTHLALQYGFPYDMQQNMERFAALGLEVRITEVDIRMQMPRTSAKDDQQATYYRNVVNACLNVPRCSGVTIWGFTDRHSWVPDTFPGEGAALIYDENYNKKPAYYAVHDALAAGQPPQSPSPSPSSSPGLSPSPSPSLSPSPSPSPSGGPGGCTATYTLVNQWPGGFQGEVRVTAGSSPINGWTVRWTFPDGQTITSAWNAQISGGGSVTATNMSYNGRLGPGQSTTFGFLGSWSGTNNAPATVTCTAS